MDSNSNLDTIEENEIQLEIKFASMGHLTENIMENNLFESQHLNAQIAEINTETRKFTGT